jgi:hypothetical protein
LRGGGVKKVATRSQAVQDAFMTNAASTHWLCAEDVSAVFAVAPSTLELYSLRGALPSFVDDRGRRRYDLQAVAGIFRRRGVVVAQPQAGSFGVLGALTLGAAPAPASVPARPGTAASPAH